MQPPIRAGWGGHFRFSEEQKNILTGIMWRDDKNKTNEFINLVETAIVLLLSDFMITNEAPKETSKAAIKLLKSIAKNATNLADDLARLDATGSDIYLATSIDDCGGNHNIVELVLNNLPLISLGAGHAAKNVAKPKPGRSRDQAEIQFIMQVGTNYKNVHGVVPRHYRGSPFNMFIAKVLEFVVPGNPHSGIANEEIIVTAFKTAGLVT